MTHRDRGDEEIRALLSAAHRASPSAPPFARLWRRASPRRLRRWRLAAAAAGLIALVLLGRLAQLPSSPAERASGSGRDALPILASALPETPLDFLLDTPGRELLLAAPRLGGTPSEFRLQPRHEPGD